MWKIMNNGRRSFIVGKEDVIKGGVKRVYPAGPTTREEVELRPGNYVYEVTNECGKMLATFDREIFIMEKDGVAVIPEEEVTELTPDERIAQLEAQIKALTSKPKRTKKPAEIKK